MEIRVKVDSIKEGGLDLERDLTTADLEAILEAEPPTGFRADEPAHLQAHLDRVNDRDIVLKARVDLLVQTECRRCLAQTSVPVPVRFTLDLVNRDRVDELVAEAAGEDDGAGEVAGTFGVEETNQFFYTGREIDLAPAVREQILLALPMDALCRADCKGLCQICGQNLNQGTCDCDPHVPDPRWAGLKNIKV